MDKPIDIRSKQMLEELVDEMLAMEEKWEKRYWSVALPTPLTLAQGLAALTKDELLQIRTKLGIPGLSSLKKQELAEALAERLPESWAKLAGRLDETRYQLLAKLAAQDGKGFTELEPQQLEYFRERGFLFSGMIRGKKWLVLPQELVLWLSPERKASLRSIVGRNTEWTKLVLGGLYYYGAMNHQDAEALIRQHCGEPEEPESFAAVMVDAQEYYATFELDLEGYVSSEVIDVPKLKAEHALRAQVPYFPFTKPQLLQASAADFVCRNAAYKKFAQFLFNHYDMSREEADDIVRISVDDFQMGKIPSETLPRLQEMLELESIDHLSRLMDQLVPLYNETKQWELKGYAPHELSSFRKRIAPAEVPVAVSPLRVLDGGKGKVLSFSTKKEVGRNDPCPCGSGKKFKKCCGG